MRITQKKGPGRGSRAKGLLWVVGRTRRGERAAGKWGGFAVLPGEDHSMAAMPLAPSWVSSIFTARSMA